MQSVQLASDRKRWIAAALRDGTIVSPCLIFDLESVDRILALFETHLPGVKLYYSVKANGDSTLLNHLQGRGIGFDVASVNEIADGLAVGASAGDMILSNTVKSSATIREIFRRRIWATTIDNELDLRALAMESTFFSYRPQIFVRIKVQSRGVEIDLNEKFGCTEESALELLELASSLEQQPAGIHFHVGTQCRDVESYRAGIEASIALLSRANRLLGLKLQTINIGGGFPDEIVAAEIGGLEKVLCQIGETTKHAQSRGFNVIAEPGRAIAAGAGIAVTQVIGRNVHDGRDWVYLDDGIYGLYSTAHYESRRFEFVPVARKEGQKKSFVVAGPTCDSLDIVGKDVELPSDIGPGDYLVAPHCGAYSISVRSHFNGMGQISTAVSQHAVVEIEDSSEIQVTTEGV